MTLTPDPKAQLPAMVTLKSGTGSGVAVLDNRLGRLVRSEISTKAELEISAAGQTIQQTIDAVVKVETAAP
jgi:hypothetical protein